MFHLNRFVKLANELDKLGLKEAADFVDVKLGVLKIAGKTCPVCKKDIVHELDLSKGNAMDDHLKMEHRLYPYSKTHAPYCIEPGCNFYADNLGELYSHIEKQHGYKTYDLAGEEKAMYQQITPSYEPTMEERLRFLGGDLIQAAYQYALRNDVDMTKAYKALEDQLSDINKSKRIEAALEKEMAPLQNALENARFNPEQQELINEGRRFYHVATKLYEDLGKKHINWVNEAEQRYGDDPEKETYFLLGILSEKDNKNYCSAALELEMEKEVSQKDDKKKQKKNENEDDDVDEEEVEVKKKKITLVFD